MIPKPNLGIGNSTVAVQALSRQQRLNRWTWLGLCSAPLAGSFFYRYGYRLPFLQCPLRALTGIPCPTCGVTRSFVAIVQGDFSQAVQYHLFGPVVFLLFLAATIFLLWELTTNQKSIALYSVGTKPWIYSSAIGLYFGYYVLRLYHLGNTGELYAAFWTSPIGLWMNRIY